ncbi:N-sulfoglucosamine sulfohydrolase [Planctomycetales bacterium 10988]|nr:N-sulfoglucosamine sulfohydrolase [Planctomycetales bacterium 10988]
MRNLSLFLTCSLCLLMGQMSWAEQSPNRPNILFVFADDWGQQASAYAPFTQNDGINEIVKMPNFDQVAKEGVLFPNAFVNAPSCTPCRSSLMSGQYFWRTGRGAILRGAVWDESIPSWPLLLHDAEYHIGKSHKVWGPGTPGDAPYGQKKYAYEKAGKKINQFSQQATKLLESGKSVEEAKEILLNEVRENFQAFLNDRDNQQPFCYWYGATNVHRKWIKGSGKTLWGIDPDSLEGRMPPFLPDVHEVRQDLADYLGEAEAFDASLGVLLETLKETGDYDDTLIIISGDHGPPGFPHGKCNLYDFGTQVALAVAGPGVKGGRVVEDFVSVPDLAPTVLEAAGVEIPEVMTAKSLWPTLKSSKEGLVDSSRTWVVSGRERHVEMARAGNLPYPQRALRTKDYLFIINFRPNRYPLGDPHYLNSDEPPTTEELTEDTFVAFPDDDAGPTKAWIINHRNDPQWKFFFEHTYSKRPRLELYDLKQDPYQMNNVAEDPEYGSIVKELRSQLMKVLKESGDPRVVDNGSFFETSPMAGPLPDDVPKPKRSRRPSSKR